MWPIFSEIDDTYDNILFVIEKGGLYSPIGIPLLSCVLSCALSSSIIRDLQKNSTGQVLIPDSSTCIIGEVVKYFQIGVCGFPLMNYLPYIEIMDMHI